MKYPYLFSVFCFSLIIIIINGILVSNCDSFCMTFFSLTTFYSLWYEVPSNNYLWYFIPCTTTTLPVLVLFPYCSIYIYDLSNLKLLYYYIIIYRHASIFIGIKSNCKYQYAIDIVIYKRFNLLQLLPIC